MKLIMIIAIIFPTLTMAFVNSTTYSVVTTIPDNQYNCDVKEPVCDYENSEAFNPKQCCSCYDATGMNDICYSSERKNQLTAFLLQFFLPLFGTGCFYLCQYEFAVPILCLFIMSCCCNIVIASLKGSNSDGNNPISSCLKYLAVIVHIVALVMIACNNLEDKCNVISDVEDNVKYCMPKSWNC